MLEFNQVQKSPQQVSHSIRAQWTNTCLRRLCTHVRFEQRAAYFDGDPSFARVVPTHQGQFRLPSSQFPIRCRSEFHWETTRLRSVWSLIAPRDFAGTASEQDTDKGPPTRALGRTDRAWRHDRGWPLLEVGDDVV